MYVQEQNDLPPRKSALPPYKVEKAILVIPKQCAAKYYSSDLTMRILSQGNSFPEMPKPMFSGHGSILSFANFSFSKDGGFRLSNQSINQSVIRVLKFTIQLFAPQAIFAALIAQHISSTVSLV